MLIGSNAAHFYLFCVVGAMIVGKRIYALIDKPFHGYLKGKLNQVL